MQVLSRKTILSEHLMKKIFVFFLVLFSLIPALTHLHIYEKDFLEILGSADGILQGWGYCFLQLQSYVGIEKLSGITARPYLVQLLLTWSFTFFGHTLSAIYFVYLIPRLLILPSLYFISLFFFSPIVAFLITTLPFFFLYFETYAIATLKADVFVVAFSLLSLLFYLKWKQNKSLIYLIATSLFLTLNILSKETATAYSLALAALTLFHIPVKKRIKYTLWFLLIPIALLGPLIIFSLSTTGRLFPSLFATGYNLGSFFQNSTTYFFSILYYTGINFNLSKFISIISGFSILLLAIGIIRILRERRFELVLPPLATLIGISLMDTRVVQGDIVGNREILHRIAFVVPFVSLYIGFGAQTITSFLSQWFPGKKDLSGVLIFILSVLFIYRYFSAPFALDYSDKEFYVNAQTILTHRPEIPFTRFRQENTVCINEFVPAGVFLTQEYRQFKTSAFPKFYKELLIAVWGIPIILWIIFSIFKKRNHRL